MSQCYALWRNRNGQRLWEGPFPGDIAARRALDLIIDKSGGSLITRSLPMTHGERLEALPILDCGTSCPACGSDDYLVLDLNGDGEPDYSGMKQCSECGEEWR